MPHISGLVSNWAKLSKWQFSFHFFFVSSLFISFGVWSILSQDSDLEYSEIKSNKDVNIDSFYWSQLTLQNLSLILTVKITNRITINNSGDNGYDIQ